MILSAVSVERPLIPNVRFNLDTYPSLMPTKTFDSRAQNKSSPQKSCTYLMSSIQQRQIVF
ncbi:hypothetical protein JG687_00012373 [Phytophthora cactorum]|uniref:Uncharacterized protein n=1 Tax=Phytophthora cactorum TaxID=29920 RepID=A0A8T1U278_9STRA|nr:hypothetical protein JG687_00012373 [Phytophthora cactorum]